MYWLHTGNILLHLLMMLEDNKSGKLSSEYNCVLDMAERFTHPCLATSIDLPSITAPSFAWKLLEGEREWAGVDANQVGQVKRIVGVGSS